MIHERADPIHWTDADTPLRIRQLIPAESGWMVEADPMFRSVEGWEEWSAPIVMWALCDHWYDQHGRQPKVGDSTHTGQWDDSAVLPVMVLGGELLVVDGLGPTRVVRA